MLIHPWPDNPRRRNRKSPHAHKVVVSSGTRTNHGAPGEIRTPTLLIRSLAAGVSLGAQAAR